MKSDISPLEKQKNNQELELIIKECILNAIRDSIPMNQILRNYLTETTEEDITITEEVIKKPIVQESTVPKSTVPESTVSESTVPESTVPESTASEKINTTLPDSLKLVEDIKPNHIKVLSNDSVKLNINELSNSMADKMQDEINKKPMIKFNDIDTTLDVNNCEHEVIAPKKFHD